MSKPSDPTIVMLAFHSDGEMTVTKSDGGEVLETSPGTFVVCLTANPGGSGVLDEHGAHALGGNQSGAYFRIDIHRVY